MPRQEHKIYATIRRTQVNAALNRPSDTVTADDILVHLHVGVTPILRDTLTRLLNNWVALDDLDAEAAADGIDAVLKLELILQHLAKAGLLELATAEESPLAKLVPISSSFVLRFPLIDSDLAYRMSRFAYLRSESGILILETPRGFARITLLRSEATRFVYNLCEGTTVTVMLKVKGSISTAEINTFLQLLLIGAIIEPCNENGFIPEDHNPVLRQWEFHDLLFHSRSRTGRHDSPMGGTFRFRGELDPQPAVKPRSSIQPGIPLSRPDIDLLMANDRSLTFVLETRHSIRTHGSIPITIQELGQFLFRVGYVRHIYRTDIGEFTQRPYPSGGASYELEFYIIVDRCQGLQRGFYYYDPAYHVLHPVSPPTDDMEMMLYEAWVSSAMTCRPQVLLIIASRFQRVSWKYQGMAYATQLKNVGVVYATMYLVANAMNLAPCALGVGNSDRFCRLAGTDYFKEGSVGEFMLGSRATYY